jgi:hypothetical protein
MKGVYVQIQPGRSPTLDVPKALDRLGALGGKVTLKGGRGRGRYVNVDFATDDPLELWAAIRNLLQLDTRLADATIVCCEGTHGWDDYLLLHHFHPTESVDAMGR